MLSGVGEYSTLVKPFIEKIPSFSAPAKILARHHQRRLLSILSGLSLALGSGA